MKIKSTFYSLVGPNFFSKWIRFSLILAEKVPAFTILYEEKDPNNGSTSIFSCYLKKINRIEPENEKYWFQILIFNQSFCVTPYNNILSHKHHKSHTLPWYHWDSNMHYPKNHSKILQTFWGATTSPIHCMTNTAVLTLNLGIHNCISK